MKVKGWQEESFDGQITNSTYLSLGVAPIVGSCISFFVIAIINYYKFWGLKQHTFIILKFWWSEV